MQFGLYHILTTTTTTTTTTTMMMMMQTLLTVANEVTMTETFSLNSLLPSNTDDYYLYNGSLTTAPCYQSVNWTVFKEPLSISATQVISVKRPEIGAYRTVLLLV